MSWLAVVDVVRVSVDNYDKSNSNATLRARDSQRPLERRSVDLYASCCWHIIHTYALLAGRLCTPQEKKLKEENVRLSPFSLILGPVSLLSLIFLLRFFDDDLWKIPRHG